MEATPPAFSLIFGILALVFGLTIIGIYFSFGPGAKKLIDPWVHDED
tara:strand:+ start:832 stop:972 length:141 start_codon:yes stop_codon:yes gene_type:complete